MRDDRLPFQRRHLPDAVGGDLQRAREALGFSRREVAEVAGIALRTLARIERGAQKPLWPTLERICGAVGVSSYSVAPRWVRNSLDLPTDPGIAPGLGLRALRRSHGITLVGLAARTGVSAATISRFERGLTASRLLARRVGGPEVAFDDRDLVLHSEPLARAMGFTTSEALRAACLAAGRRLGDGDLPDRLAADRFPARTAGRD